jgi:AcrR family transcriptional regulator
VARWEPDAYGRLRDAAMALFVEQGYEKTTVAQIAERAGLNRRTFFHHFADKREVVFGDQGDDGVIVDEIRAQPAGVDPLHAATAGFRRAADELWEQYQEGAVQLGRIIATSAELRERELTKRAGLADRVGAALQERGTAEPAATVAAWTAVAVFFVARNRWNQPDNTRTLADLIGATLDEYLAANKETSVSRRPAAR